MVDFNKFELEELLRSVDSERKYQPDGFDVLEEYNRAIILGETISKATHLDVEVENPSGFQDGSVFTRILLFGKDGHLPGQIILSSFGRLATAYEFTEAPLLNEIEKILTEEGFLLLPFDILDFPYNGTYSQFSKLTWQERFFSSFYDPEDFNIL